jgi:hypothetical protein
MLLPSDDKKPREPELPLHTPEQIKRSEDVDGARERRAQRRIVENEAEAGEIGNERLRFHLDRERIYLTIGLILLAVLLASALGLWIYGEKSGALYLLGGSGGLGGVGAIVRRLSS